MWLPVTHPQVLLWKHSSVSTIASSVCLSSHVACGCLLHTLQVLSWMEQCAYISASQFGPCRTTNPNP
jgi:hypothetical protein